MNQSSFELPSPFKESLPKRNLLRHAPAPKSSCSGKRKLENSATDISQLAPFTIRPCPASIYDKPHTLQPLRLLNRSQLPLSFFDNSLSLASLSTTQLFSANIDILESEDEDLGSSNVLIASVESEGSLYAIERVKARIYALCKLCNWVKIGYLEDESAGGHTPLSRQLKAYPTGDAIQWWKRAAWSEQDGLERPAKRPRLSMAPPIMTEAQFETSTAEHTLVLPELDATTAEPDTALSQPDQQFSSQETLDTFVRQYLDALYKSRTSLAFFAKGPLSRVRAAFKFSTQEDSSVGDLVTFLRSMVLLMTSMDKKYREKIPTLIRALPPGMLSDSEQDGPVSTKKRKSKKLPKLSKDGFYAFEDEPCKRWWLTNGSDSKPHQNESLDQLLRRRIGHLRVRETLAQIVIVLEIMALEASSAFQDTKNKTKPGTEEEERQGELASKAVKKKRQPKKALDLDVQLDLLLDKLTIWQSIEQDESINAEASKEHNDSTRDNAEKLDDRDILGSFCVEVIIPFFKSRVPEKAAMVNKKFGGPGGVSPEKLKKPRAPQVTEKKSRRPLQKTPSDSTGNLKSRPPTLVRSATDSMMPRLKRETSDISLLEIPQARPHQRDSSVQMKRLQQRQIDMFAISAATDAKLKQKAKIAEDLKDAISTLKKPNRGMAVKEYVDASEQRSLGSASMRKKTAGTNRKIFQNVQVSATPRTARKRDALRPAVPSYSQGTRVPELDLPPFPSSDFVIPSSAIRPPQVMGSLDVPVAHQLQFHGVTETPSRGKSKIVCFGSSPPTMAQEEAHHDFVGSTPAAESSNATSFTDFLKQKASRESAMESPFREKRPEKRSRPAFTTPQKPKAIFSTPMKPAPVFATPQKSARHPTPVLQTPETKKTDPVDVDGGQSIYDALGWNDDFDELA